MVSPQLIQIYLESVYRVFPPEAPELVLRIGQRHPDLDARLAAASARSWVLITAWNPGSLPRSEQENAGAQAELSAALARAGRLGWPARGESPDRGWVEESLCVLDLDPEQAHALARRFGQVAVVQGELGSEARLLLAD